MNISIISKTKYRWEYIVLIVIILLILLFPSVVNAIPYYILLAVVIILFFGKNFGYIGYKKIGELKISDDKITVNM